MHRNLFLSATLFATLATTGVGRTSSLAQAPNIEQIAISLANERTHLYVVSMGARLIGKYASPMPADQPVEFLIARSLWSSDGLFQSRLEAARSRLSIMNAMIKDGTSDMDREALDVLKNAQDRLKIGVDMSSVEISFNDATDASIVRQVVKASASLTGAASYRNALRDSIRRTLASQPDAARMLSEAYQVPSDLLKSRSRIMRLISEAAK